MLFRSSCFILRVSAIRRQERDAGLGEVDPGAAPLAVGLGVTAFGGYSLLLSNKMTGGDVHPGESTGIHV